MFVDVAFDMTQVIGFFLILVFFYYLHCVDPNGWVTLTAFLLRYVFFEGLSQGLRLTKIGIMIRLSLVSILIVLKGFVLFDGSVALWASGINFHCSWG